MRRAITVAVASALAFAAFAMPATGTVHEITGMFCAGEHGNHFPPGISGQAAVENEARPLFANGFVESVEPFMDGVLISFDFDHPASKLSPLPGVIFDFGGGLFVTGFELDSSHGFAHCKELR